MQQYEFKVVKKTYIKVKGIKQVALSEEDIEATMNKLGLLGWNLISFTFPSTMVLMMVFSRPKERLEEMV